MQEAMADLRKWSDSAFKTAAAESAHNKQLLSQWLAEVFTEVKAAFAAWAAQALSAGCSRHRRTKTAGTQ